MNIPLVYAKQSIRAMVNGVMTVFPNPVAGAHWPADDPYVLAHPEQFSDDPRYLMAFTEVRPGYLGDEDVPVETATAAPGERRTTRRAS